MARLSATRTMRLDKVAAYVSSKLPSPADAAPVLTCQGRLLDARTTLAAVRHHHWRGGGDPLLHYATLAEAAAPRPPA